MNPCSKKDEGKQPLASPGLPSPFYPLMAFQLERYSSGKPVRIKRRRTRRERNYVKFGRNVTDRASEQRPSSKGVQKKLPPFWGSQLSSYAPIRAIRETCEAKPVFITQNRLSQHLGMFNREVKSAAIERLLGSSTQQEIMEVIPLQREGEAEMQLGDEIQSCETNNSHQKSMLNDQAGSSVNDSCRINDDSLPPLVPAVPTLTTESCSVAAVLVTDTACQPSPARELAQPLETAEAETFQSNALDEKENVPPIPTAGEESNKGKTAIKDLAQDLQGLLNIKAIFPGRNLIREMRQTLINSLPEQKPILPDLSGLVLHKKLMGGCGAGITQADFKSPVDWNEGLRLESKSRSSSSRKSDQRVHLKKWRGEKLFLLNTPTPNPGHVARRQAEGKPAQTEYLDFFGEPETVDPQSFYLSAAQPHPHLLSEASQHSVNSVAERSFASKEQCPPQEIWLRTAQCWERLRKALWDPRGRQERTEVARKLQKKTACKRHCLPFITHDSLGSVNLSTEDKHSCHFPSVDHQQYTCIHGPSPEQWNLRETSESAPIHSLHPSQDLCGSKTLDLGLRTTERAACDSQTSFDVLKSIWSRNVAPRRAQFLDSRGLGYPHLTHQSSYSRALNSEQGQPKEFLELCNILPQQRCSAHRQSSQQEAFVPARHPHVSVMAKPRGDCQKEQGCASNSFHFWRQTGALARMQGTRDQGCAQSGNQACSLEQLLQMETAQQLRAFQQLPLSYFPPSEALEKMHSPLHTLQGHLLRQSSPEPWAFPRMKLY